MALSVDNINDGDDDAWCQIQYQSGSLPSHPRNRLPYPLRCNVIMSCVADDDEDDIHDTDQDFHLCCTAFNLTFY